MRPNPEDEVAQRLARWRNCLCIDQHCNGIERVIEEGKYGKYALEKDEQGTSFNSGLIGAALRTEHYEIAGYEVCIAMATTLGMPKVVRLLNSNLNAAKKITAASRPIMKLSAREPEKSKQPRTGKEKYSAKKSKEDQPKQLLTSTKSDNVV